MIYEWTVLKINVKSQKCKQQCTIALKNLTIHQVEEKER